MGMSNSGWVRRRTALLLSATLAVSPVLAVPAFATQDGDAPSPIEQNDDQTTDQGGEKDPEVEKTPDAETVDPEAEKDPDAEQGTGEKGGAAEKDGVPADTTDQPAADQPAAEPRSGDVAQVEKDGNITSYPSLREAVDEVNQNGGTLKLLKSTYEPITISRAGVTVTADPSVEYRGSLTVTGSDCKVTGMDFVLDPAGSVSNSLVVRGAQKLQVLDNSFTIQAKVVGKEVQTNSILIENGSNGTVISNNTFSIGLVVANNSAVAINFVGGSNPIRNTTISGNEMTTTLGNLTPESIIDASNMFFIIANGNPNGISGLFVDGNSVSDKTPFTGEDSRTWGIAISGVKGASITGNHIEGYVAVCGTGWPDQTPCDKVSVKDNIIDSYLGVNMPSKNVAEGGLAVSDNKFGSNVSSPVGGAVAVSDGEGTCYSSVNAAITAGETNVVLERNLTESVTIPAGENVTLDLANYKLSGGQGVALRVADGATVSVSGGMVESTGAYAIVTLGTLETNNVAVTGVGGVQIGQSQNPNAGTFTMGEGTEINASGTGACGVLILGDGTGDSTFVMNGGKISVPRGFGISGNGSVGLGNTSITINGGEVVSTNGPAIYHPQAGELVLNGGSLTGCVGVQMCSGHLSIPAESTVSVKSTGVDDMANKGTGDGNIDDAAAISLIDRGYPAGAPKADIRGGAFVSDQGEAVRVYSWSNTAAESSKWESAPQ